MSYTNRTFDRFAPADDLTVEAADTIAGRTFIAFSGVETAGGHAQAVTCPPGGVPAGVAAYDATTGELVGLKSGNRVTTVAVDADLPAGTAIEVGDQGKATTATTGHVVGHVVGTVYGKGSVTGTLLVKINA